MSDFRQIVVKANQQVFDIAIQEYGGVEGVLDLIEDNAGVIDSMDVDLSIGTVVNIKVAGSVRTNAPIQSYCILKQLKVATDFPISDGCDPLPGDDVLIVEGESLDADAKAFSIAHNVADPDVRAALSDLVIAWKDGGYWDKTFNLFPFVGGTECSHKHSVFVNGDYPDVNKVVFYGSVLHDENGVSYDGLTSAIVIIFFKQTPFMIGTRRGYGFYVSKTDAAAKGFVYRSQKIGNLPIHSDNLTILAIGSQAFIQMAQDYTDKALFDVPTTYVGYWYFQTDGETIEIYYNGEIYFSVAASNASVLYWDFWQTGFELWGNGGISTISLFHTHQDFLDADHVADLYSLILDFETTLNRNA